MKKTKNLEEEEIICKCAKILPSYMMHSSEAREIAKRKEVHVLHA